MLNPNDQGRIHSFRAALDRVLASSVFQQAPRQARFLSFVVDKTLAGAQELIKEYTIAVEVFDRPESFDPKSDSIVRVEARKLRLSLDKYYDTEGRSDSIRIELPKGGYVAQFVDVPQSALAPGRKSRQVWMYALPAAVVVLLLFWAATRPSRPGEVVGESIAVLPPVVLSQDPNDRMIAEGIASQLIQELSLLQGLRVASQSSSFQFRDSSVDRQRIAQVLGANALVEGTFQREGRTSRLMLRVVNAQSGSTFWTHTFDFEGQEWLRWQESIATDVAAALSRRRLPRDARTLARRTSQNPKVNDLYLRGQFGFDNASKVGIEQANLLYEQILEIEPEFVPAVVALANNHVALSIFGYSVPTTAARLARGYAERANQIDPDLADPHAVLGYLAAAHDWNWPEAERRFQTAIRLEPNCAHCKAWYAFYYLAPRGRGREAQAEIDRAIELDPLPINWHALASGVLYLAGDYAAAEARGHAVLRSNPKNFLASVFLGAAQRMQGKTAEAIATFEQGLRVVPTSIALQRNLAEALAADGQTDRARSMAAAIAAGGGELRHAAALAVIHAGLKETERAAMLLARAKEQHEPYLLYLPASPMAAQLRNDSRFRSVLREIGLEFRL